MVVEVGIVKVIAIVSIVVISAITLRKNIMVSAPKVLNLINTGTLSFNILEVSLQVTFIVHRQITLWLMPRIRAERPGWSINHESLNDKMSLKIKLLLVIWEKRKIRYKMRSGHSHISGGFGFCEIHRGRGLTSITRN